MTPQLILRILGFVSLGVAALFTVLAVHYYLTNHIRAVMDDLSGKARAQGLASSRGRTAWEGKRSSTSRKQAKAPAKEVAVTQGSVTPAQMPQFEMQQASAPILDDEDDMGTMVVEADFAMPSMTVGQAAATATASEGATSTVAFRVVKSIILCDSNQIIAAEEGTYA